MPSLKPIKPKRISDQVYDQLRELIYRGELRPGDQVMPERELAQSLGVSRTTVRNALNKLVALGLLEQKQGQGTFVRPPRPADRHPLALAMEAEDATLEDLLEVRMGLECNAAALAAERASAEDLQLLQNCLEATEREVHGGQLGTEEDVSFHMAIAYATKNPIQVYLMKSFYDFLFVGIRENLQHLYEDPVNRNEVLAQHRKVAYAIQRRDAEMAYSAMKLHIRFVLLFFRDRQRNEFLGRLRSAE
jgi:GntR family transcriptional repressor for pyruvate dehydrogenase complex